LAYHDTIMLSYKLLDRLKTSFRSSRLLQLANLIGVCVHL